MDLLERKKEDIFMSEKRKGTSYKLATMTTDLIDAIFINFSYSCLPVTGQTNEWPKTGHVRLVLTLGIFSRGKRLRSSVLVGFP